MAEDSGYFFSWAKGRRTIEQKSLLDLGSLKESVDHLVAGIEGFGSRVEKDREIDPLARYIIDEMNRFYLAGGLVLPAQQVSPELFSSRPDWESEVWKVVSGAFSRGRCIDQASYQRLRSCYNGTDNYG